MGQVTSQLLVRLINGVSGPAAAAARSLRQLQLAAQVGGGALGRAYAGMTAAQERNAQRTERLAGAFFNAATGAAMLGYALSFPLRSGMEYDKLLTSIAQKMEISRDQLGEVHQAIVRVATATKSKMADIAMAFDEAVSRGLDPLREEAALTASALADVAYKDANIKDMIELNRSLSQNLKIRNDELQRGNDILARQGKSGAFEIADIAKIMPALASAMEAKGFTGMKTVASLGAALQVARKAAAHSAMAGNDLYNLLTKATSPETIRKFQKRGIDIEEEMKRGREAGEDFFDTLVKVADQAVQGDMTQVGQLWEDMQAQRALRALMQFRKEFAEFRALADGADGTVLEDWGKVAESNQGKWAAFGRSIQNFSATFGKAISGDAGNLAATLTRQTDAASRWVAANEKLVAGATKAVAAIVGLRVAIAALNLVGAIAAGWALGLAAALLRIGTLARSLGAALIAPLRALQNFAKVAVIAFALGGVSAAMSSMRAGLLGLAAGALAALNPMRMLRGVLWALRAGGPIALGLTALAAIGTAIYQNWSSLGSFFEGFGDAFKTALGPETMSAIQPMLDAMRDLVDWITDLPAKLARNAEEFRSWGETLGAIAGGGISALIEAIRQIGSAISSLIELANRAASAISGLLSSGNAVKGFSLGEIESGIDGARASGGPVGAGRTYLVGERGPELFSPSRSGSIIPNGARVSGANVTINAPITIHAGNVEPEQLANMVYRKVTEAANASLRAAHADVGLKWT